MELPDLDTYEQWISLEDLVLAYRNAKSELFWEKYVPGRLDCLEYEKNLLKNLKSLRKKLLSEKGEWWKRRTILGEVRNVPKSIDSIPITKSELPIEEEAHFHSTDPRLEWERKRRTHRIESQFRPMALAPIDLHIIGCLWVRKVGYRFDAVLDDSCRGGRLRRTKGDAGNEAARRPLRSPGLFEPYFSAYQRWRQDGMDAIRKELENDRRVVGITMDLQRFFHQIDPAFLKDRGFIGRKMGIQLSRHERRLNNEFTECLSTWAEKFGNGIGLPVGLCASRLIANILLHEFDQALDELEPVYYGRYVDDVFLAIQIPQKVRSANDALGFLAKSLPSWFKVEEGSGAANLQFRYAGNSILKFGPGKQRIFEFRGKAGLDLLTSVNREISELSSEFRLMPDLEHDEESILQKALVLDHDLEIGADSLRKADAVTVKRMGLGILLRNAEALDRCIPDPKEWEKSRRQLYALVENHVITPEQFFALFQYLPKIFGLISSNGDWDTGVKLLGQLKWVLDELEDLNTEHRRKGP